MLGQRETVREQAFAAVRRGDEHVQRLKARDGVAIGIVGMQSEPEVRVGEILGLGDGAHVEHEAVVRFGHLADESHGREECVIR